MTDEGTVFNIQRFCLHDGPGIRTTVFLKGCPLSCWWCANPESVNPAPELAVLRAQCDQCGKCVGVCPEGSISLNTEGKIQLNRSTCTLCGKCVEACFPGALTIFGKNRSVEEVLEIVKRDQKFYEANGGITISGGEPLMQPHFTLALLEQCHQAGIKTCIETSGYGSPREMERVLAMTDFLFFDIKHINPDIHSRYTGKSNDLILANARLAAVSGVDLLFRIPLMPGINDTEENIKGTADFLNGLKAGAPLEILPYHRMGKPKFDSLDREYRMGTIEPPSSDHVEAIRRAFEILGIHATILV